jgi:hypothetical protein
MGLMLLWKAVSVGSWGDDTARALERLSGIVIPTKTSRPEFCKSEKIEALRPRKPEVEFAPGSTGFFPRSLAFILSSRPQSLHSCGLARAIQIIHPFLGSSQVHSTPALLLVQSLYSRGLAGTTQQISLPSGWSHPGFNLTLLLGRTPQPLHSRGLAGAKGKSNRIAGGNDRHCRYNRHYRHHLFHLSFLLPSLLSRSCPKTVNPP